MSTHMLTLLLFFLSFSLFLFFCCYWLSRSSAAGGDRCGEKPREVTMQLAAPSGLPSAIEIHILEESLETMRVGELGRALGMRNSVRLLRGLIRKTQECHHNFICSLQPKMWWSTSERQQRQFSPFYCTVETINQQLLFKLLQFGAYSTLLLIKKYIY